MSVALLFCLVVADPFVCRVSGGEIADDVVPVSEKLSCHTFLKIRVLHTLFRVINSVVVGSRVHGLIPRFTTGTMYLVLVK